MSAMNRFHCVAMSIASLAILACHGVEAAEGADAAADEKLAEVVVTGSLISDPNRTSSSPIVITPAQHLQQSGPVSIESALNQLPQFAPAGTSANGGQGTGGHATVNLHGLGSNRNLVLLDGRRLPLADIFGDVDINFIPESILSSVQTITGGASAVYGSDAMSGVVNFITLSHFEGMTTDLQYGNPIKDDFGQFSGSTAFGAKFADDRGHALLSLGYTHREGLSGAQRAFFNLVTPSSFIGQGTFVPSPTTLPSQAAVNALFSGYGAATPVKNTLNLGFNDDGTLFTQTGAKNYRGPTMNGYAILAGNVRMPVGPQTIIENPLQRKSVFSKVDYGLAPQVTVYGQVLYVDSDVFTSSGRSLTQFGTLTTIPVTNPFIPADLRALLATRPNPNAPFTWNGRYVGLPVKSWDEQYTTAQYLGGLRGSLPLKDWTWDVFASYDTTDHLQSNQNAVLKSQVGLPLLPYRPLAKKLSLGAAFPHPSYDTSGGVNPYEGDLRWSPVPSLLVRGGYQRAVRAPNIGELFAADSGSQIAFGTPPAAIGDPCDIRSSARTGANGARVRALCLAQGIPAAVIDNYTFPTTATAGDTRGNPDLQPETANTYNLGFSWTSAAASPLLAGLSASVDYYKINIREVISVVPGLTALSKCYNLDGSNPSYAVTNEFCQLLRRDANGLLQVIQTPYLNLGGLKTDGLDMQLGWNVALGDLGLGHARGRVFFNSGIGYLHAYSVQTLPGTLFQDFSGTNTIAASYNLSASFPKWKTITTLGYGLGGATVSVRWRYQTAMKDVTAVTTPANPGVGVNAYSLFDVFGSCDIKKRSEIRAGGTKAGKQGPKARSSSPTRPHPHRFDVVGRSYYVGVHVTL